MLGRAGDDVEDRLTVVGRGGDVEEAEFVGAGRIIGARRLDGIAGIDAVEFAEKVVGLGAGEILLTSMDKDGTKSGYDIALTRAVADAVRAPVIASGGVGTLDHLVAGIRDGHATAVLAASIFHFGTYSIAEAKAYMAEAGLAMRLDAAA